MKNVQYLGEGRRTRSHEHHTNAILKLAQIELVDAQKGLCSAFLGELVL